MSAPLHWTQGGIGVTNFDDSQLPIYKAAVEQFGDPAVYISDIPMLPLTTGKALCATNRSDLSAFWKVWNGIADEREANA